MPVTNLEERTVEVLALPEYVDDELLSLYFENKRRSGGGSLLSLERKGDRAILVFEDTEAAAQVLSKAQHVLHNVELTVRKPPSKDHSRLLLSGIKPDTNTELIELYVENMMELNVTDYTLYPSPGREFILIHLSKPLSKDFQELNAKVSKRTLDGAMVRLEEIEQTDSVLVENLHPGTTPDILTLYFESKRGGDQKVKDVKMLSEGTAKVSFVNFDSLGPVLDHQHSLDGADLVVKAYFDFLQPTDNETSQNLRSASQDVTESNSEDLSDIQMQTSPPMMVTASSPSSSQPLAADDVVVKEADEVMENQIEDEDKLSSHIVIADPVKLALLQLSPLTQNIKKDHPHFTIQIKDDGVHIQGPGRQKLEQIQRTVADMVANMAETDFAIERENAQFLARNDVKEHLVQIMKQTGLPTLYSVSDSKVLVTSLSQNLAQQACKFLKSQPCHVNIPLDVQYECMLYCREWSEFLQALSFCTVKVSERERTMDVLTLKGMENEKETVILQFLTTPIERETVIPMEPGVLKYIQTYCHHLLADMDQVYIFPLEAEDVTGLKIHGHAVACQMAEEVLQGIVSSICTKTITVNAPGVSRFLGLPECKDILDEMERKFQVYINPKQGPWEPLPHQDILKSAWTMLSHRNIQRVSVDDASPLLPSSALTNGNGAADKALLEEAKKIVSAIDEGLTESGSNSEQNDDMDNMDLYTAEEPTSIQDQDPDIILLDTPQVSAAGNTASGFDRGLPSDLEEEAQLSLAIQYSMESSQWPLDEEEEQLKKALELSMIQQEASSPSTDQSLPVGQLEKSPDASLQDAIKAANTIQLEVFASYSCDLIRVDIAFGKKVSQRQAEEKLEHRSVRNFSEYHMKCLELIKRKHAVEIKVQGTIITVSGFKDFVFGGMWDLKLFMEHITNPISREEILRTAQWVLHDPASSDITPYSPDATVFIENAWRMKLTKVDVLLDNQPHTINFEKMQEYNITSGNTVKISRKMLNSADLNEDIPEEEYSLLSNMPEATKVDEESDEFQNVVKDFYGTIQEYHSKIRIIQVEKLMNRLLYNQYKLKKASILQRATYPEIERTLYHGTSEASVKEICIHGFDRSFCGKNATVYGQGVYFAVNSALSIQDQYSPPNADGYKFVFVSKVLTGDFTKGCHSMKTAPLKETGDIPLRYDSVTDDITKPSMFVIFNDTQAFPEYLITCQRIHS